MEIMEYLRRAVEDGASDLLIIAGGAVSEKVEKQLQTCGEGRLLPKDTTALIEQLYQLAGRPMEYFDREKKDNFSLSIAGLARFRVNVFQQRGSMAAAVRIIQFGIPDAEKARIPAEVLSLAEETRGLILLTGLAASGKSVTQACLVDRINRTREAHIVTIEDPIEYLHHNERSIVSQQEAPIDVVSTAEAMINCLQQSPDVIAVGTVMDCETLEAAIRAAETGRLVIGALYAQNAVSAIDYVIHSFPPDQQGSISLQFSMTLRAVVSQQLLMGTGGNLVPVFELLRVNPTIQGLIRENFLSEIERELSSGREKGMFSMDESILNCLSRGMISRETAIEAAVNPEHMREKLHQLGI